MTRLGLTADTIIETAAQMANEIGIDKISIKLLAEKCNIKSPSFYNHFTNLDEIKNGIMLLRVKAENGRFFPFLKNFL